MMTEQEKPRYYIVLEHDELNSVADIAKHGVQKMLKDPQAKQLIESIATSIAEQATGISAETLAKYGNQVLKDKQIIGGPAKLIIRPPVTEGERNKH